MTLQINFSIFEIKLHCKLGRIRQKSSKISYSTLALTHTHMKQPNKIKSDYRIFPLIPFLLTFPIHPFNKLTLPDNESIWDCCSKTSNYTVNTESWIQKKAVSLTGALVIGE